MIKIYLSPSNQPANRYCVGNTTEKAQMEAVAQKIKEILDAGYDCQTVMATLSMGIGYNERPKEAKDKGCSIYLAIHSNAGGAGKASGAVAFYHPSQSTGKALTSAIVKELNAICPVKSNRAASVASGMNAFNGQGYGEIRSPYQRGLITVLAETDFHDNPATARWTLSMCMKTTRLLFNSNLRTNCSVLWSLSSRTTVTKKAHKSLFIFAIG